jgi:EAL domain-containing protein (putative c-di-GMP-specific phosphodiesterase class I)
MENNALAVMPAPNEPDLDFLSHLVAAPAPLEAAAAPAAEDTQRRTSVNGLVIAWREVIRVGAGMESPFIVDFSLRPLDATATRDTPELGSVESVEHWMAEEAVAWIGDKRRDDLVGILSVSLATVCRDGFLQTLEESGARAGVLPESVCFEVPASAVSAASDAAIAAMRGLRMRGYSFAFGDFRPDTAGLDALKRVPPRYLRVTLGDDDERAAHAALVAAHRLARGLGLASIADGVSSEDEYARVRRLGVAYASGDLLGAEQPLSPC